MKLVFILSLFLVFLLLLLSVISLADEVIVVVKGGRMERGELSKREGYVVVKNKVVRGKLLKQGAWLRTYCRDNLERRESSRMYSLNDMWKEGGGFFIAIKHRKCDYVHFEWIGKSAGECWRVVKNN